MYYITSFVSHNLHLNMARIFYKLFNENWAIAKGFGGFRGRSLELILHILESIEVTKT